MASFTIKITGNPGAAIQAKIASIKQQANASIQFAGLNCEGLAKQACPVDTGRLRSSIAYNKTSESSCACGTDVSYAKPVEMGHKSRSGGFVAPRPFLLPAFQQAQKQCLAELKAIK